MLLRITKKIFGEQFKPEYVFLIDFRSPIRKLFLAYSSITFNFLNNQNK